MRGVVFSNEFFDCLPVHVIREGKEFFLDGEKEVWQEISYEPLKDVLSRMGYEGLSQVVEVCLDCISFLKRIAENLFGGLSHCNRLRIYNTRNGQVSRGNCGRLQRPPFP